MDRDGSILSFVVDKITDERLDIAVKNDPHEFARTVDHWTAGIPSDDVTGRDEVIGRVQIDVISVLMPAWR